MLLLLIFFCYKCFCSCSVVGSFVGVVNFVNALVMLSILSISYIHCRLVKIWDYQNKACVQTLEGHAQNVTAVAFHSELPILMTGSEDGRHGMKPHALNF